MYKQQNVICIIGMHRSGTSLVTGILQKMGLYLGPEENLMKTQDDNPAGFFENECFRQINDSLLKKFGGSWYNPPSLEDGWEFSPSLEELYQKAKELVKSFSQYSNWGWKDPRTVILLPFWKLLLPNLKFVICVRSPLEIVKSLSKRNRLTFEQGTFLWDFYMKAAILNTEGSQRIFMFYEDFFMNGHNEIKKLASFCSLELLEDLSLYSKLVYPDLKHHKSDTVELLENKKLLVETKLFYIGLRALNTALFLPSVVETSHAQQISEVSSKFLMLLEEFRNEHRIAQVESLLLEKDSKIASASAELHNATRELLEMEKLLVRSEISKDKYTFEVTHYKGEINHLHNVVGQKEKHIAELTDNFSNIARQLASVQALLQQKDEELIRLKSNLQEKQGVLDSTINELQNHLLERDQKILKMEDSLVTLQDQLLEKEQNIQTFQANFEELQGLLQNKEQNIQTLQANFEELQVQLQNKEQKIQTLQANFEELHDLLQDKEQNIQTIQANFEELEDLLQDKEQNIQTIQANFEKLQDQLQDKEQNIQTIQANFEELEDRLRQKEDLIAQFPQQNEALSDMLKSEKVKVRELAHYLDLLLQSNSWRMTKPLRTCLSMLKSYGKIPQLISMKVRQNPDLNIEVTQPVTSLEPVPVESRLLDKLNSFLNNTSERMMFPYSEKPVVSIIIPTFNKVELLFQCLESLLLTIDLPAELIIVDDCSSDDTEQLFKKLENVRLHRNEENLDFLRSCNKGASLARGENLLFLNNDVILTPQCISTLANTMREYPECGAVGAKIIQKNGTLQEAGSIVWRNGSCMGYGRDDFPYRAEYCYVKEVDFCSGACLLVDAAIFNKLGGFDERYVPAYYEEADLCFGVRKLGYKVVYQPQAIVFHHEYGTRSSERAIALMEQNQPKFKKKWSVELKKQSVYGDYWSARDRRLGKRVLVMDDQIPAAHLGSGFPRAKQMLEFLAQSGFVVTFIPLSPDQFIPHQPVTHQLQQMGIEVFYGGAFYPVEVLRKRVSFYDTIIISRPHNGEKFLKLMRDLNPKARLIYDAEALYCLRDIRQAEIEGKHLSQAEINERIERECCIMDEADVVITVSENERNRILSEKANKNVIVWGFTHEIIKSQYSFEERKDILFVGAFTAKHPPNIDAVNYFVTELFPEISKRLPECRLVIAGSSPPDSIRKLASEKIIVTGYVEDLKPYYHKCRVFIVPLRFGAGINYKVTEAMSYEIPSVITAIAAEGLDVFNGQETLISYSDDEFVENVEKLYTDKSLWYHVQEGARQFILNSCNPQVMKEKLYDIVRG